MKTPLSSHKDEQVQRPSVAAICVSFVCAWIVFSAIFAGAAYLWLLALSHNPACPFAWSMVAISSAITGAASFSLARRKINEIT